MPMDILAEICSHRSSSALLRLSRTNRLFRSLLLSRDWRCIWTAARVDAGLPAVKNLDEVQYALLLYGSCCFDCGVYAYGDWDMAISLWMRKCVSCIGTLRIKKKHVASRMKHLHPQTVDCVVSTAEENSDNVQYLISDLESTSAKLWELQQQEACDMRQRRAALRFRKDSPSSNVVVEPTRLERFIVTSYARIALLKSAAVSIKEVNRRAEADAQLLAARNVECREARLSAFLPKFVDELGYTNAEFQSFSKNWTTRALLLPYGKPPSTDIEEATTIDAASWQEHRADVRAAVAAHREANRVQAIRLIVSATTDTPIDSLPSDSASYDLATYNATFFARMASQLLFVSHPCRNRVHTTITPYPRAILIADTLSGPPTAGWLACKLAHGMSRRHIVVVRALLAAAELDEDTATAEDLDEVGKRFQWAEYPVRERGAATWEWKSLMRDIPKRIRDTTKKPFPVPTITLVDEEEAATDDVGGSSDEGASDSD